MPSRREDFTRWAESLGHIVRSTDISDSSWAWGLLVEDSSGVRTVVAQPEDDADRVAIQTSVVLADVHKAALSDLDKRERELFLSEVRLTLHALRLDSAFVVEGDDGEDQPEAIRITLSDQLVDENLNRATFDATLRTSRRALDAVNVLFSRLTSHGE